MNSSWIVNPTCPRKGLRVNSLRAAVRLLSARFSLKEQRSQPEIPARGTRQGPHASDPQVRPFHPSAGESSAGTLPVSLYLLL